MPAGSHIGQIGYSSLADSLPEQFLTRYDYEFLYLLRSAVLKYQSIAENDHEFIAYRVIDELTLYLIVEESREFLEEYEKADDYWDDWAFRIFNDMDIVTFLYSNYSLVAGDTYYFDNWMKEQFFCD